MTTGEFADAVQKMRDAQKYYFKTRTRDSLKIATDLEKQVDKILSERETRNAERMNPPLFEISGRAR